MEEFLIVEEGEFRGFSKEIQSYFRQKLIQCEAELKDLAKESLTKMSETPVNSTSQPPQVDGDQPDRDLLSDLEQGQGDEENGKRNYNWCRAAFIVKIGGFWLGQTTDERMVG